MKTLPVLTILVAVPLALGEVARWWNDPRLLPLAFDELLVAVAMVGAALTYKRFGPAPLAAAWGVFSGLVLSLLVPTLDHLVHGPPKESALFYAVILCGMLLVGVGAVFWSLAMDRESRRRR